MSEFELHEGFIVCPECDLILRESSVEHGFKIVCPRCGTTLRSVVLHSPEKVIALALAGLLFFIPAIFFPLLTLQIAGLEHSGSVWDSAVKLIRSGFLFPGIMVLLTAVVVPLANFIILLTVAIQIQFKRANRITARMFRLYHHMEEWGMLEVYMIGILVTIIKLFHMARIIYDTGFFCFIGLIVSSVGLILVLDEHRFWEEIEQQGRQYVIASEPGKELDEVTFKRERDTLLG